MFFKKNSPGFLALCSIVFLCVSQQVFAQQFTDIQETDFGYEAAYAMQKSGVMTTNAQGKFRPDELLSRAEAVKIVSLSVGERVSSNEQATGYSDVVATEWFAPYVAWAAKKGIIDSPTKQKEFKPENTITKASFVAMLLRGHAVDFSRFSEIDLPLSSDVRNTSDWVYPIFRYAVSAGVVVSPRSGLLAPERKITRLDAAILTHRFVQYQQKNRIQALLDEELKEISATIIALDAGDITTAGYTSARALLQARGAHIQMPDQPVTKAAVKTAEAIRSLVRAYKVGVSHGKLADIVQLSKDAWFLADQAEKISGESKNISQQIKKYASSFATSARENL